MTLEAFSAFMNATGGINVPAYGSTVSGNQKVRVLTILDQFSTDCFSPEIQAIPVSRADYSIALDYYEPAYVLVESAWQGSMGAWQHQLVSPSGPKPHFLSLVEAARKRNVPIVFWNKEDPPHYEQFLPIAKLADYIYTSAGELIGDYADAAGHSRIDALPFAAQPRIHHPFLEASRDKSVCFAGQYFSHKFPERRAQMDILFPAASKHGLDIYSRELGKDPRYAFPSPYSEMVRGSLPYNEMVREYRRYKMFLNVNSVESSPTMCARRVFELSASGTVVLSTPAQAISAFYSPDEVYIASIVSEAEYILADLLGNVENLSRASHRAWRRTLREHTYSDRVKTIHDAIGIETTKFAPDLTAIIDLRETATNDEIRDLVTDLQAAGIEESSILAIGVNSNEDLPPELQNIKIATLDSIVMRARKEDLVLLRPTARVLPQALDDLKLALRHYSHRGVLAKSASNSPEPVHFRSAPAHMAVLLGCPAGYASGMQFRDLLIDTSSEVDFIDSFNTTDGRFSAPENSNWRL